MIFMTILMHSLCAILHFIYILDVAYSNAIERNAKLKKFVPFFSLFLFEDANFCSMGSINDNNGERETGEGREIESDTRQR